MEIAFPFRTSNSQGVKALNKPITLLWLIGQYYLFKKTDFTFIEVEGPVGNIIKDYTGNFNIVDPFWRLRNDNILSFLQDEKIRKDKSGGISIFDMRQYGSASFTKEFFSYISPIENLIQYCESILENYFTESFEEDILFRSGLDYRQSCSRGTTAKRKRDPKFRESVAIAYNNQCAVCGFNLMLGGSSYQVACL